MGTIEISRTTPKFIVGNWLALSAEQRRVFVGFLVATYLGESDPTVFAAGYGTIRKTRPTAGEGATQEF